MALLEEVSFSAVSSQLPAIMGWVEEKTIKYLPYKLAMRLQLAAEETIVNVVKYAYSDDAADRPINLRLGQEGNFYLEISDKGVPFNPLKNIKVNPNAPLEERILGGWGRELIIKMTSAARYEYRDNTNILHLEENPADAAETSD